MSQPWLERLNQAVEYQDLHLVLSEIATESRTANEPAELVASIDEAIRRIHQEKIRDQDDWDFAEKAYRRFRLQHQGICGWIRRHLPFTKTRKIEKQHTRKVDDRKAELLANHLIIARAEMIKEQLLPPETRRLGHTPTQWNEWFSNHDSIRQIDGFADGVKKLGAELTQSRVFVDSIDAELKSFANVRFDNPDDQRRKDSDLSEARKELATLKSEIEEETKIRNDALNRLGTLVSEELAAEDAGYRSLHNRVRELKTVTANLESLEEPYSQISSSLKTIQSMTHEIGSIPSQRAQLSQQIDRLQRQSRDAESRLQRAQANHRGYKQKYQQAQSSLHRVKSEFAAADKRYSAYLVESGQVEMPAHDSSSLAVERSRLENQLRSAETDFQTVSGPYQASKTDVDHTERELRDLQSEREQAIRQEDQLEHRIRRLKSELESTKTELTRSVERTDRSSSEYLDSLQRISREDLIRRFDQLMPSQQWGNSRFAPRLHSREDMQQSIDQYARAATHLRDVRKTLESEYAAEKSRQHSLWTDRCVELFGEELAGELDPGK